MRVRAGQWIDPARRIPSLTGLGAFRLLNEDGNLVDLGWDDTTKSKLWRYNQHYFDDLNAANADARREWHCALIENWIAANPPAQGTGWEPYPTSLRIVNWVKWTLAGSVLSEAARENLAMQARWLARRLEWHLLGNHLFANAKALVFAGLFFKGPEAERWLARGLLILEREIPEQILPDGGQFELSPMYHALAVEDMLDLINLTRAYGRNDLAEAWIARIPAMLDWLATMSHPDGRIAFLNDTAFDIAPENDELFAYARRLGFVAPISIAGVRHLTDSGYVRVETEKAVLIVDVARIGPDYLPGHAHADTLSFELSVFGQRALVNSGTSCYDLSAERSRQRGTAAHNTVVVDGHDSSETWASFRVARRARPKGLCVERDAGAGALIECAHDGYRRLPGRVEHRREWRVSEGGLCVEDRVSGVFGCAEARFHLHPEVSPEVAPDGKGGILRLRDGQCIRWQTEHGILRLESASWHPRFGVSVPTVCLVLKLQDGCGRIRFGWD